MVHDVYFIIYVVVSIQQEFQWIEYFAGKAACTTAMRSAGYHSARFDFLYFRDEDKKRRKSNFYDLLTPAGFAFLG